MFNENTKKDLSALLKRNMKLLLLALLMIGVHNTKAQKIYEKDWRVAIAFYELEEFSNALPYLELCYKRKADFNTAACIADCYYQMRDFSQAEYWYLLIRREYHVENSELMLAKVQRSNGKYAAGINTLQRLLEKNPTNSEASELLRRWEEVAKWKDLESDYLLLKLKGLNTSYSEICAVDYKDGIVFSSSRESTFIRPQYGRINTPYLDLYYSELKKKHWKRPTSFSSLLNSHHHEGACTFSNDYQSIYFTRSERVEKSHKNESNVNPIKLYKSEISMLGWTSPLRFVFNDSLKSYAHPSISEDGKIFYFSSDRDGGYGGMDIYFCVQIDSLWSEPVNLGPVVNTSGNECYPFIHQNGYLYFSSDGHSGLGGLDVFSVNMKEDQPQHVENLRAPINSFADDFGIFLSKDKTKGYLTSNRPGGMGAEDIYMIVRK